MKKSILVCAILLLSASGHTECPTADLSGDCYVGLADLAIVASQWMTEGAVEPSGMVWIYIDDSGVGMKDLDGNVISHGGFTGYMSKYETTNAQYCEFLNAALSSGDLFVNGIYARGTSGSNSGADFEDQRYYNLAGSGLDFDGISNGGASRISYNGGVFSVDSGFDTHPVSYVSWYGAAAFCNYYGYRLPTEWEWQAAADYDGSFNFGCGPSISNSIANYFGSTHPYGTSVVGRYGAFGYGMCDVAGNVWEWTASIRAENNYRYLRGGSWHDYHDYDCTVSFKLYFGPYNTDNSFGFRVCR